MKIAIIGYGKMGKAIEKQALSKGHEVVLRISKKNSLTELVAENFTNIDAAIEFSQPETAFTNIAFCLKNQIPVVSGTTGWLDQMEEVTALCKKHDGTFFYASNYSIGVNMLFALNRYLSNLMQNQYDYKPSIEEIHHTQKLDYPSGTAITLAEGIIQYSNELSDWQAKMDDAEEAKPVDEDTLPILSKRIENVPGSHYVRWSSPIDNIEINHVAHSREGFVMGALSALEWVKGKKGIFGMKDMLGF